MSQAGFKGFHWRHWRPGIAVRHPGPLRGCAAPDPVHLIKGGSQIHGSNHRRSSVEQQLQQPEQQNQIKTAETFEGCWSAVTKEMLPACTPPALRAQQQWERRVSWPQRGKTTPPTTHLNSRAAIFVLCFIIDRICSNTCAGVENWTATGPVGGFFFLYLRFL